MKTCAIDIDNNGNIQVQGENASLFYEASLLYGNDVDALNIYKVSLTDEFKSAEIEPSVQNVLSYIEVSNIQAARDFTQQELQSIYAAPNYNDFLQATTVDGEFILNRENLLTFYTEQEADELLEDSDLATKVHQMWYKLQNLEQPLEEYDYTTSPTEAFTEEKTVLGKYKPENLDQTYVEVGVVAAGVQTLDELIDVAYETGIPATQEVLTEYSDKQAVQQYVENPIDQTLEKKVYNSTQSRLLFTFDTDVDSSTIQREVLFLQTIDNDVLSTNTQPTQDILFRIEEAAEEIGIPLTGLSDSTAPIQEVKDFLNSLYNFLTNPNTVEQFSTDYNNFFSVEEVNNRPIITKQYGRGAFQLQTTKSEAELFNTYSIIKIAENIYKKVNRNYNDLYEDLYKRVLQDPTIFDTNIFFPYGFDNEGNFSLTKLSTPRHKPQIKQAIKKEVESRVKNYLTPAAIPNSTLEELVIHKAVNRVEPTQPLNKADYYNTLYDTNNQKFVDSFLQRINKYMIKHPTLPLTFTQRGLELQYEGVYSAVQTLTALPKQLQEDLIKYAQITNSLPSILEVANFEHNLEIEQDVDFNRNFYTNFKDQLPPYTKNYTVLSTESIQAETNSPFIRIKNEVYEQSPQQPNVYSKVPNQDSFSWDRKQPSFPQINTPTPLNQNTSKTIVTPTSLTEEIDQC